MNYKKTCWSAFLVFCIMISSCALVKPNREIDQVTPIDWGIKDAFESGVTIYPFDASDEKWGVYAAKRMKEYLLEQKGFRRVVYSEQENASTSYELRGELEYMFYGGTHSPSRVCVTVRVIDAADGHTRFMRIARTSSEKKAFHMTWLSRVYVPSPYPEELLNALLKQIARDIANRTGLPAKKCP